MASIDPAVIWSEVLKQLSKTMSPTTFTTFVKPLRIQNLELVGEDRAIVTLGADSPYVAQQAEMRCYAQLKKEIDTSTARQCDLVFSGAEAPEPEEPTQQPDEQESQQPSSPLLDSLQQRANTTPTPTHTQAQINHERRAAKKLPNPEAPSLFGSMNSLGGVTLPSVDRYKLATQKAHLREDFSFDTFAVSGSNEMAHAAAQAVAKQPGQIYNPLFLWGNVGVGKTHIMQAIGNVILKTNPDTPLLYCMGEEFLNEIISAIRTKRTMEFKEKYRNLKVLLIDDIQFIAGKDTAQEEFFHTFNAITRAGGQVIMTSDRPPYDIHPLEERLRSRFEAGLTVDIQQPTFELRTAILLIKSQKRGMELPMEIAQMIASEVESARKLEGVLSKLHSTLFLTNQPLSKDLVRSVLGNESRPVVSRKKVKPGHIVRAVTSHYHVSPNTLRSGSRKKEYVLARHVAMYLLKSELDLPYTEIGSAFGGRDHSSVMHAVQKIEKEIAVGANPVLAQEVQAIRVSLAGIE
jgi:chromosomal replication initiator protein